MRYNRLGYKGLPVAGIALFALGILITLALPPLPPTWLKMGVMSAAGILGCTLALASIRYADEVMLQTKKTAWFWGSLIAPVAMIPVMLVLGWRLIDLHLPPARAPQFLMGPQFYLVIGMGVLLAAQGVGCLIATAWLSRRR